MKEDIIILVCNLSIILVSYVGYRLRILRLRVVPVILAVLLASVAFLTIGK